MSQRTQLLALVAFFVLVGLTLLFAIGTGDDPGAAPHGPGANENQAAELASGGGSANATASGRGPAAREVVAEARDQTTGVRGVVVDGATGAPVAGVEVVALRQPPAIDGLVNRFRGLFRSGMWAEDQASAEILGSGVSGLDGGFEILGLPPGTSWIDGRSEGLYVRTPAQVRVARGEIVEGVELRGAAGGRVQGVVLGPDGGPVTGARVSLRPGLNAFLGQMTERKYRWLETTTDSSGRYQIQGVPTGAGYSLSAGAATIALEERHGVELRAGETTTVDIYGNPGATVLGTVVDAGGAPVRGASVAMVYLDVSRVLFSADGRAEPITTDADGRFRIDRVAAGRVAFVGAADGLAPSNIEERAVVDGGVYEDLELRLGVGERFVGKVVDQDGQPLAGATIEIRPMERPQDSDFLKMMLKIRRLEVSSGADGMFEALGLAGERLTLTVSKRGFTKAIRSGVALDAEDVEIVLYKGAVIAGYVVRGDGKPLERFRVRATSRMRVAEEDDAEGADPEAREDEGVRVQFGGRGRGRGGPWGRAMQDRTRYVAEGEAEDGGRGGGRASWREIMAADGRFVLTGIPPGDIEVQVRADGFLDSDKQELALASGERSADLVFTLGEGIVARGRVVDAVTGTAVADATVTAYLSQAEDEERSRGFRPNIDPEDFDFLGMSQGRGRTGVSDSKGEFEVEGLRAGDYRFTARHPDLAKASAKDVSLVATDSPVEGIEILIDSGGGVEGNLTGVGMRPLPNALVVAFSISAGDFKSSTTDATGYYRIDGLTPGQYLVFKSRMDEGADNIGLELMSNMRVKTVSIRKGRFTRLDIHDQGEEGVLVHGIVREQGKPVSRALVTALGTDREGIFGMGVRANAADRNGRYELAGLAPGSYLFQVSTFRDGRPLQTNLTVEVPYESMEYYLDLDIPASAVAGRVIDSAGQPVEGVSVALGAEGSSLGATDGLLGMIAQAGMGQARTDENGEFRIRSVAQGTYRLTANGSGSGRRGRGNSEFGRGELSGLTIDGFTALEGLVVQLPTAGVVAGLVVDGSGNPVAGAEIHYERQGERRERTGMLGSLIGMQQRPLLSKPDGSFEVTGLTPGTYSVRADAEGLETAQENDVQVLEGGRVQLELQVIRGATLKVRVTNVDKTQIPLGNVSLLDGQGKPIVRKTSVVSLMRRFMSDKDTVDDSGWYTFGSVPPDEYTAVVQGLDGTEFRFVKVIRDGETVEWDIDLGVELSSRGFDKAGGK